MINIQGAYEAVDGEGGIMVEDKYLAKNAAVAWLGSQHQQPPPYTIYNIT